MSEANDRKIVRYIRNIGIAWLAPGEDAEKGQMLISKNGGCFLVPQEQISIDIIGVGSHPEPPYIKSYPSCLKIKFNDETIRFYTHNISDTEEEPTCLGKFQYYSGGSNALLAPTVTFTPNWYYMSSEMRSLRQVPPPAPFRNSPCYTITSRMQAEVFVMSVFVRFRP